MCDAEVFWSQVQVRTHVESFRGLGGDETITVHTAPVADKLAAQGTVYTAAAVGSAVLASEQHSVLMPPCPCVAEAAAAESALFRLALVTH